MSQLEIHAERCVHQQVTAARCADCVTACPRGAWQMHEGGLGFDDDTCDDCGLCVAACPTEALALPAPETKVHPDEQGRPVLWLACERAGVPGTAGVVPCLYALSPGWLLQQCAAHGATRIEMVPGPCAGCARGVTGAGWRAHWLDVAERLQTTGQPAPALRPVAASAWPAAAPAPSSAPDPARRRLFGRWAERPAPLPGAPAAPPAALSSARRWTVAHLQRAASNHAAPPLWSVTLDAARCTLCTACAELCPTSALRFDAAADGTPSTQFTLDMRQCTGCGLCTAGCADQALSAPATPPIATERPAPAVQQLPLARHRCSACRIDFLQFAAHDAAEPSPALCPVCRRGRAVQVSRLIQTDGAP